MKIYKIYVITNILNGKKYVGYTSFSLRERFSSHKRASNSGSKQHIHHSMKKYGYDNFIIEPIYSSLFKEHIRVMERHFIRQYDTFKNGYNMTYGGEGVFGLKLSECHKKKLKESTKGIVPWAKGKGGSDETKILGRCMVGNKNPMFGKRHSKEAKEKMSLKKKNYIPWNKSKRYKRGTPSWNSGLKYSCVDKKVLNEIKTIWGLLPYICGVGVVQKNGKKLTYMRAFSKKYSSMFNLSSNGLYIIIKNEKWKYA